MTNAVSVQSSLLARVAYDSHAILQVTFRNGAAYQYAGVPVKTYRGLLQADSKGAYFNHCIRGLYPYEVLRLKEPAASG
jgi:KTSC domain